MIGLLRKLEVAFSSGPEQPKQHAEQRLAQKEREKKVRELLRFLNRKKSLWEVPPLFRQVSLSKGNLGMLFIEHTDPRDQPFDFVARLRGLSDEAEDLKRQDGLHLETFGWPNKEHIRCSLDYEKKPFGVSTDGDLYILRDWANDDLSKEANLSDGAAITQLVSDVRLLILSFSLRYDKRHLDAFKSHVANIRNAVDRADVDSQTVVLVVYSVSSKVDLFRKTDGILAGEWGQQIKLDNKVSIGVISTFDRIEAGDFDRWHDLVEPKLHRSDLWGENLEPNLIKDACEELLNRPDRPWMREVQRAVEQVLVTRQNDATGAGR